MLAPLSNEDDFFELKLKAITDSLASSFIKQSICLIHQKLTAMEFREYSLQYVLFPMI